MEVKNFARQFIQKRPNTSLFVGFALISTCIPVAIFLAVVVGLFMTLLTGFLVVQSTVIGLGLTTLLVILPGPLCFAAFCTLLIFFAQCLFAKLKLICTTSLGDLMNRAQNVSCNLTACQGRRFSEKVMAFMNRGLGNTEVLVDMDESMTSDDGYGDTSLN